MIVVNLMGGLGNQLFQYAAGKSLALRHGVDLKYVFSDSYALAKRSVRIDNLNIEGTPLSAGEASDYFPKRTIARALSKLLGMPYEGRIFRETNYYSFDPAFLGLTDKTYLYGFWQSWQYFKDCDESIRKEFTIKNPSENYEAALTHIKSLDTPVSIHIRRGDYLNEKSGFASLPLDYYVSATKHMTERLGIFSPVIFSDDIEWAKTHLLSGKEPILATDFYLQDFEDLMLMSHCSHHIIANSSFSWWGAWLNASAEKRVVAPGNWHDRHTRQSTLIPPSWTILY